MVLPNVLHTSSLLLCTEVLYKNVFAVFLLFWFQRGGLQFKRFLIIREINNCVMFVSFSRMLSAHWSLPTDYSNYACDFCAPSERKVCLTSSNFEMPTFLERLNVRITRGSFLCIRSFNIQTLIRLCRFSVFIVQDEGRNCYLFYCSRNICQGIKRITKLRV